MAAPRLVDRAAKANLNDSAIRRTNSIAIREIQLFPKMLLRAGLF